MRTPILLAGAALIAAAAIRPIAAEAPSESEVSLSPAVVDFVDTYCMDCHNEFTQDGDRSFEAFLAAPNDPAHHLTVEEMLDQLNLGKMPKQEKDVAQPSDSERRAVVAAMTDFLIKSAKSDHPLETPLRRLTNREYANTLKDLFGHDPYEIDGIGKLPPDTNQHGFLNIGEAQAISRAQLQSYVDTAGEVISASYAARDAKPAAFTNIRYLPKDFLSERQYPIRIGITSLIASEDGSYLDIMGGRETAERPIMPLPYLQMGGAPQDGIYTIRVKAMGLNRYHDYKFPHQFYYPSGDKFKLGIGVNPDNQTLSESDGQFRKQLHFFDVPEDAPGEFSVKIRLNKGNIPFLFWPNGAHVAHYEIYQNAKIHYPDIYERFYDDADDLRKGEAGEKHPDYLHFIRHVFKAPRIRLYHMDVSGPEPISDPVAIGPNRFLTYKHAAHGDLDKILTEFASAAYRRPVTREEVAMFANLSQTALAAGRSWDDALKLGFTAILSSPRFLYLDETVEAASGHQLDAYALASRLSYFLWRSMPDEALLADAASGALTDGKVLSAHTRRMLLDPRADEFVAGFTDAWLRLDKLGGMPPDPQIYWQRYYKKRLERAMRKETELLFSHVLRENLPPARLLDADYTFLNDALALHYGVEGEFGEQMQLTTLPKGSPRRGVAGHASILTASANGVETSPVVRGVWVLENLLGTPPSPPPPDVPAIEPDTRGATTIRQLLAKHRNVQACADCHAHIDPYGFPLEVFGPAGEFRTNYPGIKDGQTILDAGIAVDSATTLASGETIASIGDFHGVLSDNRRKFETNLLTKLLTYGTGREMTFRDRPEIEQMVDDLDGEKTGFLDMMEMLVNSAIFRSP